MKHILPFLLLTLAVCGCTSVNDLKLNDLEYLENRGVNVLVYNNAFSGGFNDEKNSGIEIIHHGVRTVQGGAVRLNNTPEQWDLVPALSFRHVNPEEGSIEVGLRYDWYDFDSRIVVRPEGESFIITVELDKPLPEFLEGKAGFNLEFLPSQYWLKTYEVDGRYGRFPRYAVSNTVTRPNSEKPRQFKGYKTYDDRGTGEFVDPLPFAEGHDFLLAPEEPGRTVRVTSESDLKFYDGRMIAQNGWFVLRSLIPSGKTGEVLSWKVTPGTIKNWTREPNIGFSQVGYLPGQPKRAVIELDPNDKVLPRASLYRIGDDGSSRRVFSARTTLWGRYFKYNYLAFDFSEVREPGAYFIKYGDVRTGNFLIGDDVYEHMTDATSDVWIPIHMNHMTVNEAYRIWHGEPFKEGYLQAPAPTDHFDLHWQGPTTDTRYKALELIPGLNVGGFFDAGDFDIETESNISVVQNLVNIWERFKPMRDETFVDEEQRYVDLHRPDGVPDILQYIKHGTLNLVAQAENIGHMAQTLSNSILANYHHLGDAAAITDGLHYDPALKPYQRSADGKSSGTPDDMWAFTSRNPMRDFLASTTLAAASRALKGFDDELAGRALAQSRILAEEAAEFVDSEIGVQNPDSTNESARRGYGNVSAYLQLYVTTGEREYLDKFDSLIWTLLDRNLNMGLSTALDAVPYLGEDYREKLRPYVASYAEYVASFVTDNPYGVPISLWNWAGGSAMVGFGATVCTAHSYFPDLIGKDGAWRVANYIFGCHPYHNYSLVAAVGAARPKAVFYGNNRADFSFIPGNMAPGILFRNPDHFENYDDWPFLWGQNEGTIAGNTGYLTFGLAFKNLTGD